MTKERLAEEIVKKLGGKENITFCTHCITRLRFRLADYEKIKREELEQLEGVMGVTEQGGQFQVIIGTAVESVYNSLTPLLELDQKEEAGEKNEKKRFSFKLILDTLTAVIAPIIPALSAAGMMKCICLLLTTAGLAKGTEGAYVMFDFVSDVAFYFLPVLIAWSASKRFKVDTGLAVCVAGALLYPSFMEMVNGGEALTFFGIQVPMYSYSATIFPALLGVWLLSKVHRLADRIVKLDAVKLLIVPLVSLGITIPVTFLVLAPLGNWGANILVSIFTWMIDTIGPFAGLVIGFFMPVMTLTGLHQSLSPIEMMEITNYGFTLILTIEFIHNLAEAGAALGTALVTKNKQKKAAATETGFTAFIGISEPALYTVMVSDRKAMLSAMIGNGVGGFLSILMGVSYFSFTWPNIFSIPTTMGGSDPVGNMVRLVLAGAVTFVVAFILPGIFRKFSRKTTQTNSKEDASEIGSPAEGRIIKLEQVHDETFSKGICGPGAAVVPANGEIFSPCSGRIVTAMDHAVGISTADNKEILLHVGIDTAELKNGEITLLKKKDDRVKKGELLFRFNKEEIKQKGYDDTVIILRTDGGVSDVKTEGNTKKGEMIFRCI